IAFKLAGGVLATGLLLAFAPAANSLLHKHGLTTPLLIGAFIPLAQCTENVGGVAIVLRGRYDVRAFFLFVSMALRFTAIAVAARARTRRVDEAGCVLPRGDVAAAGVCGRVGTRAADPADRADTRLGARHA